MVAVESALRPRVYFGPGLSTQPSGFITPGRLDTLSMYHGCMVLILQVLLYNSEFLPILVWLSNWLYACTLTGFVVAVESA